MKILYGLYYDFGVFDGGKCFLKNIDKRVALFKSKELAENADLNILTMDNYPAMNNKDYLSVEEFEIDE